ncbi:MAG: glycosyltransferase, partial [Acidimicrobiales bacterium]|nr:glycosyltransferase [Acidimicrobiales bacterium]
MIDPDRLLGKASATDRDVRILNLLNRDHRRGAETFAVALGAALSAEGHDVTTVALAKASSGPTFAVEALAPAGAGLARMVTPLRRFARGRDVVVGHGSDTLLAAVLGLTGTGTPFVYRIIGDPEYWTNSRARQMRVRFALHRTTAVAVYYEAAAETLRRRYRLPADKIRVIPKGIDVDSIAVPSRADRDAARRSIGIDPDTPVVLTLGALAPEKNIEQVIEAVTRLENVTLLIAGSGPCRADLERRASALGITDRVLFLGGVDDPAPVLAAADVLA